MGAGDRRTGGMHVGGVLTRLDTTENATRVDVSPVIESSIEMSPGIRQIERGRTIPHAVISAYSGEQCGIGRARYRRPIALQKTGRRRDHCKVRDLANPVPRDTQCKCLDLCFGVNIGQSVTRHGCGVVTRSSTAIFINRQTL